MSDDSVKIDVGELERDIHGSPVEVERACDYCGGRLDLKQPVMYDVIRIVDMPHLERWVDVPPGWIPDASRCRECEQDSLSPKTEGLDEALVVLHLNESNGAISIDSSSLELVDSSPTGDGHHPPPVPPRLVDKHSDLGLGRWIRVLQLLELANAADDSSPWLSKYRQEIEESKEAPPEVQRQL